MSNLSDQDLYEYDPEEDEVKCCFCNGTGLSIEGWDCEECDGNGFLNI